MTMHLLLSLPRLLVICFLLVMAVGFMIPAMILLLLVRAFMAAGDPNK